MRKLCSCTPSATYAMKFVGTSNSAFLIPAGDATPSSSKLVSNESETDSTSVMEPVASILKVTKGIVELIQTAPRLDKLRALLNERPYILEEDLENDSKSKRGMYSWQNLVELTQASEEELRAGLKFLSAVEIDGCWRIVGQKSMDEVLNMILNNSVLYEWPLNALAEDQLVSTLEADGFSQRIVLHCLETYGSRTESMEGCLWGLDEKHVCLRLGLQLLVEER